MATSRPILPNADETLDTSGLSCPEPVMMMHNKVAQMSSGQTLLVIATDPATRRDVPKFCQFLQHEMLAESHQDDLYHYLIRLG